MPTLDCCQLTAFAGTTCAIHWHAFVININELRNEPRRIKGAHTSLSSRAAQMRRNFRAPRRVLAQKLSTHLPLLAHYLSIELLLAWMCTWKCCAGSWQRQEGHMRARARRLMHMYRAHYTNDMTSDKRKCKLAYKPGFVCSFLASIVMALHGHYYTSKPCYSTFTQFCLFAKE